LHQGSQKKDKGVRGKKFEEKIKKSWIGQRKIRQRLDFEYKIREDKR